MDALPTLQYLKHQQECPIRSTPVLRVAHAGPAHERLRVNAAPRPRRRQGSDPRGVSGRPLLAYTLSDKRWDTRYPHEEGPHGHDIKSDCLVSLDRGPPRPNVSRVRSPVVEGTDRTRSYHGQPPPKRRVHSPKDRSSSRPEDRSGFGHQTLPVNRQT